MEQHRKVLLACLVAGAALIVTGILSGDAGVFGNLFILAIVLMVLPPFLSRYAHFLWLRAVEEQFPLFVRDLADASRSGMSFREAIAIVSRSNYGKLTQEVRTMNNRLSWGTPFLRVLQLFGAKVKGSKLLQDALDIISESYLSGGNINATLESVSRDMLMLKEAEAERASMVNQQVMIMYGIFFMFLGISLMIVYVMVPMLQTQGSSGLGAGGGFGLQFSNPCAGIAGFPCAVYTGIGTLFSAKTGVGTYYVAMFFVIVLIQALFTGLIAGQLGENSVLAGTKHSIIMLLASFGIFVFATRTGLLPI